MVYYCHLDMQLIIWYCEISAFPVCSITNGFSFGSFLFRLPFRNLIPKLVSHLSYIYNYTFLVILTVRLLTPPPCRLPNISFILSMCQCLIDSCNTITLDKTLYIPLQLINKIDKLTTREQWIISCNLVKYSNKS